MDATSEHTRRSAAVDGDDFARMDKGHGVGESVGERSNFKKIPTNAQDHGDA